MGRGQTVLRVERGQAGEEELAALMAVLFVLLERGGQGECVDPPVTASGWWEPREGFAPPGSWR